MQSWHAALKAYLKKPRTKATARGMQGLLPATETGLRPAGVDRSPEVIPQLTVELGVLGMIRPIRLNHLGECMHRSEKAVRERARAQVKASRNHKAAREHRQGQGLVAPKSQLKDPRRVL